MDRLQMKKKLEGKLSSKRFEHSIGVEYTAATMAFIHGVDEQKAMIAGLLHDCAKYVSNEKKILKCEKRNIPISECEYANPELLHAKLSAAYAKENMKLQMMKYYLQLPGIQQADRQCQH